MSQALKDGRNGLMGGRGGKDGLLLFYLWLDLQRSSIAASGIKAHGNFRIRGEELGCRVEVKRSTSYQGRGVIRHAAKRGVQVVESCVKSERFPCSCFLGI